MPIRPSWTGLSLGYKFGVAAVFVVLISGCLDLARPDLDRTGVRPISDRFLYEGPENPITLENDKPGSSQWRLQGPSGQILAYASPFSVAAGEPVQLHVSSALPLYRVDVYRLGWYGGDGGTLVSQEGPFPGLVQSARKATNASTALVSAEHWKPQVTIATNESWTSGVYIAKVVADAVHENAAMFVVRSDVSDTRAPLVMHTSDLTWQAYNDWGGTSLYTSDIDGFPRAYQVSYDRPYAKGVPLAFSRYELPLIQTFERAGLWIDYASDIDLHSRPDYFGNREGILTVGHSEYWTREMRDNLRQQHENGTNHGVFSANTMYWQVRLDDSSVGTQRVVTCYKSRDDPMRLVDANRTTVRFRDPLVGEPEFEDIGIQYVGLNRTSAFALVVQDAAATLFKRAPPAGTVVPGLVSHEWDAYPGEELPARFHLLGEGRPVDSKGVRSTSLAVMFQNPQGGAWLFNSGSFGWAYAVQGEPAYSVPPAPDMLPWIVDIARLMGGDASVLNPPLPPG